MKSSAWFALSGRLGSAALGMVLALWTGRAAPPAHLPAEKLTDPEEILRGFSEGQSRVRILVNLMPPADRPRGAEWHTRARLRQWHQAIRQRQDEVLVGLTTEEYQPRHRFENQAGFSAEVSLQALEKLARHPLVASIEPVRTVRPQLRQGLPLMNAALSRPAFAGAGVAVAIVDTGVDYRHPMLGGGGFPNAKVLGGYDFGDRDADPLPNGNAHGTACAGIAAGGLGEAGDYIGGVAPQAKLYALKITVGTNDTASDDAIIAAWDWCVTHRNDVPAHPIVVISTSFGGGRFTSPCDSLLPSGFVRAVNNATDAGITVLVASGNDGYCDALAKPACLSGVISVGAVYDAHLGTRTHCVQSNSCIGVAGTNCTTGYSVQVDAQRDRVTAYANVAPHLDLLAPADHTSTLDIVGAEGYADGDYTPAFTGTSAACPYAAGAVAALQSAARSLRGSFLTPAEVRQLLIATGDPITDTKSPITKPRVNLGRAVASLLPVVPFGGGTYVECFDELGPEGTNTPPGWYVGAASGGAGSISGIQLAVDNGSRYRAGDSGSVGNLNYGSTGGSDRALGSLASSVGGAGGDRVMEVRLRNDTGYKLSAFTVRYDGEQWRAGNGTTAQTLALRFSTNGSNFVDMGPTFRFVSPVNTGQEGALDGNSASHRVAAIGGLYTPPMPVAPGATIFLRWLDPNDSDVTDHGLAIDNFTFEWIPPVSFPLSVESVHPGSGVVIGLGEAGSISSGTTPFTQSYYSNATITLAAPWSVDGSRFQMWRRDGSNWSSYPVTSLTLDGPHTMTAVYGPPAMAGIAVGPAGVGPLAFAMPPEPIEFATGVLTGNGATFGSPAQVSQAVSALAAGAIVTPLPGTADVPPAVFAGGFRHNASGQFLQSRPTTDGTNAANVLLATLWNNSGATQPLARVSYAFAVYDQAAGELPGFQVFYSLSGEPGSWQIIPALSGSEAAGLHQAEVEVGTWAPRQPLYLLWVDDNANGVTDPAYTLDDLTVWLPAPPTITVQPRSRTVVRRVSTTFTVEATAAGPLSFQWRFEGTNLPGATNGSLVLWNIQVAQAGRYDVQVSSGGRSVLTEPALLTVVEAPTNFPPSQPSAFNCAHGGQGSNYRMPLTNEQHAALHVISVYEGPQHELGDITVRVNETNQPVVLALSAYQPVVWRLEVHPLATLQRVYVAGFHSQQVVGVPAELVQVTNFWAVCAYAWEPERNQGGCSYLLLMEAVRYITGLLESSFQGCYAGNIFEIPFAVSAATSELAIARSGDGGVAVALRGVAGQSWLVEAAESLAAPAWTPVGTVTLDALGRGQVWDSTLLRTRFYRARRAP